MKPGTTRTRAAETNAKTDLAAKIDLVAKTGPATMTGPIAKTDTIAKTATRKAEEKRGAEGKKKHHFAISMGRTKFIGPMNAQSQLKRRQSSNAKMHNQQNQ